MNKNKIDLIFITNLPSFYKINLYNEIAKKKKILVIFTGDTASLRNPDFFKGEIMFKHIFVTGNSWQKAVEAYKTIHKHDYKSLILGGWDSFTMWIAVLLFPSHKNAIVIESSYLESKINGINGILKRFFLKRISKVYASGKYQVKLVKDLGYNREIIETKGVGIFNIIEQPKHIKIDSVTKFIYVGRLSKEKNIKFLIDIFNQLPNLCLNIVGYGPQENELKSFASKSSNIVFWGPVENKKLPILYQSNHVLILPSSSEPWGLVVEEALNNGIPAIISNKVGCKDEVLINNLNGLIFSLEDKNSLKESIIKMTEVSYYNKLRESISKMDFRKNALGQINCYLK